MKTNRPAPAPSPSPSPSPTPPLLHRPKNGLQQHLTRENRSDPYLTGPVGSHNPRNPHLTRIFRDVCALKSSRSPPYAATRNFCTLRIFLQDRLLNFRHPKIFDMRHELNLRRTKIFDMGYEKFQSSTYRTFRTSVML